MRAEYNSEKNYLEYYAGLETLDKVISIKDQIIYGRRGTGKTHLLKALQEKLLADDQKYLPVYIDLRTFKPTLESNNDLYYALIIFQEIVVEVLKCVYVNLDYLYQEYTVEQQKIIIDPQRRKILALLEKFNRSFIIIFCLLDEWSEIPETSQYILAEFLKRTFVPKKVTLKIAAIPNRTQLISENRIGLEDGGDIFGFPLDNRYIYELYPEITKAFFNELLYKQLYLMDPQLYEIFYDNKEKHPVHNFINIFLANQALREILIASAGIPRDFLNIFISAYNIFFTKTNNRHLVVADIRNATVEWYGVDKKKTVDANSNAKLLLDKIIDDILITKKRCHFLIPEKYEKVKELNDLIDLRVIHLRKRGISHKGNKGVVYNVYYLDYACYTSTNLYHNKINTTLLNEIETIDDFREIRRVSLEDKFFEDFNMNIGNSFKCPKCGGMIDMNHPSYAQHKICMHCWSKIEE